MSFRPSKHGWPFANPVPAESAQDSGAAPFPELGVGGGMCLTALDRYLAGVGIPAGSAAPEPGDPLHEELRRRQTAALDGVRRRIREVQAAADGSWRDRLPVLLPLPFSGRDAASASRAAWRRARRSIDRGEPALLTLTAFADGYRRSTAAWQVLAYAYEKDGGRVAISIYDPAHPGDDRRQLVFSLHGPLDAKLTGGRPVRAFLHQPYDRVRPPAIRAESFADRAVIGLNRRVAGRLSALAGRQLQLFGRDGDGSLIHFWRRGAGPWEGANITERDGLADAQLYGDAVAVRAAGMIHVFSRSYVGDLLHFRRLRRWTVANRTEHRRAGPRFRLEGEPVPVAGPRGALHVFGRGTDGALVHYETFPLRPWTVTEVGLQAPMEGDPITAVIDGVVHVVCRTRSGHLLHIAPSATGMTAVDLTEQGAAGAPRAASAPAVLAEGRTLHVVARDPDGQLVHAARSPDGAWTGSRPGVTVQGDPVLVPGPAGAHLFVLTPAGALVHGWRSDGEWRLERLLDPDQRGPGAGLLAWGESAELGVLLRDQQALWRLVWREPTGWTLAPLRAHAGVGGLVPEEHLVAVLDRQRRAHLFGTNAKGTVLHVEPADWSEPGPVTDVVWGGEVWPAPIPSGPARGPGQNAREAPEGEPEPPAARYHDEWEAPPAAAAAAAGPAAPVEADLPEPVEADLPEPVEADLPEPVEADLPEPAEHGLPEPLEPALSEASAPEPEEAGPRANMVETGDYFPLDLSLEPEEADDLGEPAEPEADAEAAEEPEQPEPEVRLDLREEPDGVVEETVLDAPAAVPAAEAEAPFPFEEPREPGDAPDEPFPFEDADDAPETPDAAPEEPFPFETLSDVLPAKSGEAAPAAEEADEAPEDEPEADAEVEDEPTVDLAFELTDETAGPDASTDGNGPADAEEPAEQPADAPEPAEAPAAEDQPAEETPAERPAEPAPKRRRPAPRRPARVRAGATDDGGGPLDGLPLMYWPDDEADGPAASGADDGAAGPAPGSGTTVEPIDLSKLKDWPPKNGGRRGKRRG